MIRRPSRAAASLAFALLLGSCDEAGPRGVDLTRPVSFDVAAPMPKRLSSLNLFAWNGDEGFAFNDRVVPYDLNTPLFSDYALKQRAIYLPEGTSITYVADDVLDFPVGTLIVKSFYFPADFRAPTENLRIIETRVLVRRSTGWEAFPYIWNDAQTDATLEVTGDVREIAFIDADGAEETANYLIPQRNQCQSCHARKNDEFSPIVLVPIGPRARNLNRDHDFGGEFGTRNQLTHLASLGMLTGLPDIATVDAAYDFAPVEANGISAIAPGDVERAARDYLDVNCAHCHNAAAPNGITSQLFLNHDETDPYHLGICKRPGSAGEGTGGFTFDVLPGNPDESILYFRVETESQGAMMPLIGRSITHRHGSDLVRAWIAGMPATPCE